MIFKLYSKEISALSILPFPFSVHIEGIAYYLEKKRVWVCLLTNYRYGVINKLFKIIAEKRELYLQGGRFKSGG